jgi:hypothetical protein
MRFFQKTLIAFALFFSFNAKAFTPESGFWWNPNESGSGYAIEIQDNYLFIALYVYDEVTGDPIWYTAGTHLEGNAYFDTDLNYSYDGTCIDCNYSQPITIVGARGPITINFLTEISATIQFQGAVKNIERFNFLLGDEIDRLIGEWQTVIDFSSTGTEFPFVGDVLLFDITTTDNGDKFAEGCRPDNSVDGFCSNYALNNHDMAAFYDYQNDELIIVLSDSQEYWLAYYLEIGLNQFDGVAEYYPKDFGNNYIYYPVRGFKTASRSFIETGVGPSKLAKNDNKKVVGINDRLNIELPTKKLSDFSKQEQVKVLRRQMITNTLISQIEKKK